MVQSTTGNAAAPIGHPPAEDAAAIDLLQFCGRNEFRPYLLKPFRYKGHVYATDGRILVRVPDDERYDVHEKIAIEKLIDFDKPREFVKAPRAKQFPPKKPPEKVTCTDCDGRGTEHDCPDCECECDTCNGEGSIEHRPLISTEFAGQLFDFEFMRMLYSLPDLEYAPNNLRMPDDAPILAQLFFRFKGGEGVVMPLSRKYDMHVEILARSDPPD